jgi:hypothetical protein
MTFGKKSLPVLSLLSMVFCAGANATPASSSDVVTFPVFQSGAEVNFTALLLRPTANNLNYTIYNKALPLLTPSWQEEELKPSYNFAFNLGARYQFQAGYDLSLGWTHLNSTTNTAVTAPNSQYFVGPDFTIGPFAGTIRSAAGSVNFKYDVVNLDAGRYVDFGSRVQMRFFGGLSTGFLREKLQRTFNGVIPSGPPYQNPGAYTAAYSNLSDFSGVGPRAGMSAAYDFAYGFGLLGEAAASVLIGNVHTTMDAFTTSAYLQANGVPNGLGQSITNKNSTRVVPGFDAKLGVNYKHAFAHNTLFIIEGGYESAVYIKAINQYEPAATVASADSLAQGLYPTTLNHTQNNYAVHGPFLKFRLQF